MFYVLFPLFRILKNSSEDLKQINCVFSSCFPLTTPSILFSSPHMCSSNVAFLIDIDHFCRVGTISSQPLFKLLENILITTMNKK